MFDRIFLFKFSSPGQTQIIKTTSVHWKNWSKSLLKWLNTHGSKYCQIPHIPPLSSFSSTFDRCKWNILHFNCLRLLSVCLVCLVRPVSSLMECMNSENWFWPAWPCSWIRTTQFSFFGQPKQLKVLEFRELWKWKCMCTIWTIPLKLFFLDSQYGQIESNQSL